MTHETSPSEPEDTVELGAGRDGPPSLTANGPARRGLTLVAAAGAGILTGYLIFSDDGASTDPAEAHVDHACEIATRLVETHGPTDDWGGLNEDPVYYEVPAIQQLLNSAAVRDQQYEDLADIGNTLVGVIGDLDLLEDHRETFTQVADACDEL